MNTDELAYIAGLMDGEGTILIRDNYIKKNWGWQKHGLSLLVEIGLTDKELLPWLCNAYGGSVYRCKDKRKHYWKEMSRWHLSANQALHFLLDIFPYLRLKKEQAEVAIAFQSAKRQRRSRHRTEQEMKLEETQHLLIKELKGRGIPDG